ncbi:Oidioi.mRNA.OKI2018_I69.PAR.g10753.t1.cds [Oikopleura dioica]|uniref:Oidioi.mRNA.OKI2018_I69.PAR.g10753.t1.cds n=1 Tax=Oikopleura dioica TaxID=34765 RepID=A0ABN7RXF5_OIKDI|nr:Oidioi.mRNA.OKI2018_I69.PAR.g10753.t1.cds [Oikopleura dioica]
MGFASGPFDDFHRSGRTDWHSTLKKLVGKNRVAEVVKENSQKLVQRLLEKGNTKEGIDPKIILINTVLTTTTSFSFGKNYEDDDPEFLQVRDWIDEYIDGFLYLALKYTTLDLFPSWFGQSDFYFNLWAKSPLQKLYKAMPHFMTYIFEQVKEARKGLDKENPRHFLDMLIIRADEEPRWGYFQLAATIINIYAATGDTLSNTMLWLLMTLADNPEIQEKMHEEIKEARMKDPYLNPADIPYTRSVLLENQRRNPITDSLAHMVSEETVVQGVVFPKNSTVIDSLIYAMTKAALDHMSITLSGNLALDGIRVNSVNPAVVMTDIWKKTFDVTDETMPVVMEKFKEMQPMGILSEEECAHV